MYKTARGSFPEHMLHLLQEAIECLQGGHNGGHTDMHIGPEISLNGGNGDYLRTTQLINLTKKGTFIK